MCNFGKGHHKEHFCEIILNLGQWFRRCHLKDFLSGALATLLFGSVEPLCNFERGHYRENSCEIILNLDAWFRRRYRLKQKFTAGSCMKSDHNNSPLSQVS